MRLCPLLFVFLIRALSAGEGPAAPAYPFWDGQESVAQYAERVGLPPTEMLECGNGVKLELVLIPAGKFIMGTPEPEAVDEESYLKKIEVGIALLAVSGVVLLVLLGTIIVQAIRKWRRPQFSLARFLAMALAAGVAVLSGMHWRHSVQALEKAKVEYQAAKVRFDEVAENDEKPAHPVTLTRPFYMGKFKVTEEQYQQVMGRNPSNLKGQDYPVRMMSWDDAQEFCKRLTAQTKWTVRLPTEAEWGYSCRAGTRTRYYSGDTDKDLDRVAWYEANSKGTVHPVGQKEPNAFVLFDMHGNVVEWCQDEYEDDYYSKSPTEDPQGPTQGGDRVVRGSSWLHDSWGCGAALRSRYTPSDRKFNISFGFRVVVSRSRS